MPMISVRVTYGKRKFTIGGKDNDSLTFSFEELKHFKKNDDRNNGILIDIREVFPGSIMRERRK